MRFFPELVCEGKVRLQRIVFGTPCRSNHSLQWQGCHGFQFSPVHITMRREGNGSRIQTSKASRRW